MKKTEKVRYLKKVVALYLAMCVVITGVWVYVTLRTLTVEAIAMGEVCAMWSVEGALSYLIEKETKRTTNTSEVKEETGI